MPDILLPVEYRALLHLSQMPGTHEWEDEFSATFPDMLVPLQRKMLITVSSPSLKSDLRRSVSISSLGMDALSAFEQERDKVYDDCEQLNRSKKAEKRRRYIDRALTLTALSISVLANWEKISAFFIRVWKWVFALFQ